VTRASEIAEVAIPDTVHECAENDGFKTYFFQPREDGINVFAK